CARPPGLPLRRAAAATSATFLAISRELLLSSPSRMHSNRGFGGTWAETLDGSWKVFVWGWKRPQSMPATYAPGPRCNATNDTKRFLPCQALNTRYSVSLPLQAPHVGGIPVDKPEGRLGTGWVFPVHSRA